MEEVDKWFVVDSYEPDKLKRNVVDADTIDVCFKISPGQRRTKETEKWSANYSGYLVRTGRFYCRRGWRRLCPHSKPWYFWGAGWNFQTMSKMGYLVEPPEGAPREDGRPYFRAKSEIPCVSQIREFARLRHDVDERWLGLFGGWPARFRPERKPENSVSVSEAKPALFRIGWTLIYPWGYELRATESGMKERIREGYPL